VKHHESHANYIAYGVLAVCQWTSVAAKKKISVTAAWLRILGKQDDIFHFNGPHSIDIYICWIARWSPE